MMWERIIHNLTITEARKLSVDEYYTLLAADELIEEEKERQREEQKRNQGTR